MKKQTIELKEGENFIEINEDIEINAMYVGRNEDMLKSKIWIVHSKPGFKSRINIKAVVFDKARFDFEAVLKINKGAINTDTYLKINCLVMSDTAFARAIPSLEIKESEVKGGHGATIGYLDPVQTYYLSSRGVDKKKAENILVDAFIRG
ncbi:MAG: SufD family Fe-S cluster assembly protein [Candidatus Dojkabacteria bacterium]